MSPRAIWIGPFDAMLPDRSRVRVGDIADVTDSMLQSAHWQPLEDSPPASPAPAAKAAPVLAGGDD